MPHATKKCFPTKCRKCNAEVLYWESTQGAKVFLNLPIYGKPIRHICKKPQKKKQIVIEGYRDHLRKKKEKAITYQCPICNKIFGKENQLNEHFKQLKKIDDAHSHFFNQILDLFSIEENIEEDSQSSNDKTYQTSYNTSFMNDRFILKTKDPKKKKKYEKLYKG